MNLELMKAGYPPMSSLAYYQAFDDFHSKEVYQWRIYLPNISMKGLDVLWKFYLDDEDKKISYS